jgi:hypothetical protein
MIAKALTEIRSVTKSRLVGSDPLGWHRNWTDYGVSGTMATYLIGCHENVTVVAASGEELRIKGE